MGTDVWALPVCPPFTECECLWVEANCLTSPCFKEQLLLLEGWACLSVLCVWEVIGWGRRRRGIRVCPRCLYPQVQASLDPYCPSYSPGRRKEPRIWWLTFYKHAKISCFLKNRLQNKNDVTTAAMDWFRMSFVSRISNHVGTNEAAEMVFIHLIMEKTWG